MAGTGGQHTQQQAVKPRAALCPLPLHPYLSPHGGRRVQRSCPRNIIIIISRGPLVLAPAALSRGAQACPSTVGTVPASAKQPNQPHAALLPYMKRYRYRYHDNTWLAMYRYTAQLFLYFTVKRRSRMTLQCAPTGRYRCWRRWYAPAQSRHHAASRATKAQQCTGAVHIIRATSLFTRYDSRHAPRHRACCQGPGSHWVRTTR